MAKDKKVIPMRIGINCKNRCMIYFLITLPSCIQLSPLELSHSHLEHSNFYNEIQTALLLYPPRRLLSFLFL